MKYATPGFLFLREGGPVVTIIKKINNNAALALDLTGREIVVLGTGIGFPKVSE